MSHATISMPVFGSAGQGAQNAPQSQNQQDEQWQVAESPADGMDFDLLAEYLLDESPADTNEINFDFNGGGSGIVSPEQSDDGSTPNGQNRATSSLTQVKHLITQHAAGIAHKREAQPQQPPQQNQHLAMPQLPPPAPMMAHLQSQPQPPMSAPVSMASAPAPPVMSHPGTHIYQAPAAAPPMAIVTSSSASAPTMQQAISVANATKRRRVDAPALSQPPPLLSDPAAVAAALQNRGRKKTQAQIDRRRERNRILARRTRLRKKFFFESLQKEVMDLQRENSALKGIVREKLDGDEGQKLLEECDAAEKMPEAVMEACGDQVKDMAQQDFNLVRSIQSSQNSFIITDPSLQDNPIVFASDDFLTLTGYARDDVLGRNCRFLQGTETSQEKVKEIGDGLSVGDDVSVTLINYTADGSPFWNKLFIAALRDAQNNIVNYIGVIVKVASPEPGDSEHGKLLPGEEEARDDDVDYEADMDNDGDASHVINEGSGEAPEGASDS